MSAKHTAGPWNIFYEDAPYPGIDSEEKTIVLWGDDGEEAGVHGDCQEERVANAHLIAAAPELLEALKILTENIEHAFPGLATLGPLVSARAAIKKALGEAE